MHNKLIIISEKSFVTSSFFFNSFCNNICRYQTKICFKFLNGFSFPGQFLSGDEFWYIFYKSMLLLLFLKLWILLMLLMIDIYTRSRTKQFGFFFLYPLSASMVPGPSSGAWHWISLVRHSLGYHAALFMLSIRLNEVILAANL